MDPLGLPVGVEVHAPRFARPHRLPVGLGQAPPTAQAGEVELAERLGSVAHVPDHRVDEASTRRVPDPLPAGEERAGRREALLDGHGEQRGGLPVGRRPLRRADCRHLRPGAAGAGPDDGPRFPQPVVPDARHLARARVVGHGHVDHGLGPTPEPGREEPGGPVEPGAPARLPERPPPQAPAAGQVAVDREGVASGPMPRPALDLGPDLLAGEPRVQEHAIGDDAFVGRRQFQCHAAPSLAHPQGRQTIRPAKMAS